MIRFIIKIIIWVKEITLYNVAKINIQNKPALRGFWMTVMLQQFRWTFLWAGIEPFRFRTLTHYTESYRDLLDRTVPYTTEIKLTLLYHNLLKYGSVRTKTVRYESNRIFLLQFSFDSILSADKFIETVVWKILNNSFLFYLTLNT